MKDTLKIVKIEPAHEYTFPKVKHPILPQHEFSMVIVAPKGSGKTNFICNLLINMYKGYFHEIWVCSPTVENDQKWSVIKKTKNILVENKRLKKILQEDPPADVKIPTVVHRTELDAGEERKKKPKFTGMMPEDMFFTKLTDLHPRLAKQEEIIHRLAKDYPEEARYIANRVLVIIDDQAGEFSSAQKNPESNFVIRHRHYGTSVIVVTQAYKAIPKTIRTNCNALIAFEIANRSERKVVYEEWPDSYSQEDWNSIYEYATSDPFSFIYINTHFPKGHRVFRNFEEQLSIQSNAKAHDEEERPKKQRKQR